MPKRIARCCFTLLLLCFLVSIADAQTTAFTYQGKLTDNNGMLLTGQYDFQFKLFDTATVGTGTQQGATVTPPPVTVTAGLFTVELDFGACATCFNGAARFLETAVKPTSGSTFTTLGPRQPITSTPYALKSQNAANAATADGLSVACVNCVTSSQIQSVQGSQVTGNISGSQISGTIPVASVPSGSSNYIQNTSSPQASSNFNISGNGTADILNATTQFNLGGQRVLSAGSNNLFAGINAGTSGSFNAFFGDNAGATNSGGFNNAFFGSKAGFQNTTGCCNAFFGTSAGFANSIGFQNTFIGYQAGFNGVNPTGDNNTLLGAGARVPSGSSNATAIGANAQVMQGNSLILGAINGTNGATADTSVGIGTTAPGALLDVQRDQGIIPETARFTTYGSANEILSRSSGGTRAIPTATPSGQILLQLGATGHNGSGFVTAPRAAIEMTAAEVWAAGATGTLMRFNTTLSGTTQILTRMTIADDGNVGIGTTAPENRLHVAGAIQSTGARSSTPAGNAVTLSSESTFDALQSWANRPLVLNGLGNNVGIGTTVPNDKLDINGIIRVTTLGAAGATTLCRNASNQIATCSSSLRYKDQVRPFSAGLDTLSRLRPISFTWKQGGQRDLGLAAEEVEKVEPLLVTYNDKGEVEGVKYDRVNVLLINAVNQQQEQIEKQRQENQRLRSEVEALKKLVCLDHPAADVCK